MCILPIIPSTKPFSVDVEFANDELGTLESDTGATGGDAGMLKAYRKRLQVIRAASDERDFLAFRSWRFEKLKGKRQHQHSIRLNDQWRLIIELKGENKDKIVRIVGIKDYH